ncbi:UNVERIFIED_CONTAM: putative E3 ubiquitin-protein ligase HIP1 [Sesamum indicum]
MGHRHMFNAPQVFETDSDQGWNHAEQPYMPIDSSFFGHDQNSLNTLNSHPNSSLENGGYNNDVTSRNHVPPNANNHLNQPIRGVRSGYSQRSAPTFRASSSNFRPGHIAASDGGQQMVAESYPSRHPRAASNLRLRHVDRHGRTFVSTERHRSFAEDASFRDRLTPEELLALGERIGSVSTGLSDGLISKCLTESIYCSSDLSQDEGTCVICLEEYKNMDDVGTLKVCGHDFHVGCIRKWLSMKNLCPICKASAVDDNMKEK